jgi:eukaryotic-like serine/threonine-protein kinase
VIGKTISHFSILEKLGEGGMGVVYKARDSHLDRLVAIKVLPPEKVADPERKQRFMREAKAASSLNHPNIITVHEVGNEDGLDFIVMEFVVGKPLSHLIGRKGLRLSDTLKYGAQLRLGEAGGGKRTPCANPDCQADRRRNDRRHDRLYVPRAG